MKKKIMRHRLTILLSLFFVAPLVVFGNIVFAQIVGTHDALNTTADQPAVVTQTTEPGGGTSGSDTTTTTDSGNTTDTSTTKTTVNNTTSVEPSATITNTTNETPPTTSDQTVHNGATETVLEVPKIISVRPLFAEAVSGDVEMIISTSRVKAITLYLLRDGARTPFYLGKAQPNTDRSKWRYVLHTRNIPNGKYSLGIAGIGVDGSIVKHRLSITVHNRLDTTATIKQKELLIQEIQKVAPSIQAANKETETKETTVKESLVGTVEEYSKNLKSEANKSSTSTDEHQVENVLQHERQKLRETVKKESQAINESVRQGDRVHLEAAKERILQNIDLSLERIREAQNVSEADPRVAKRLREVRQSTRKRVENLEVVIREKEKKISERVDDKALKDFDHDGISDYDEVNIYGTDPTSPDSDNDGYTDGAEILGGFDPVNEVSETSIVYESPKESGTTRSDILAVHDVALKNVSAHDDGSKNVSVHNSGNKQQTQNIVFSGKGLPDSFVTLYIYSSRLSLS